MPSGSPGLPARVVLGSEAMSALAVPARYALLSHLLDAGPRTASECAEVVGESPSNCSWHLRAGGINRLYPEVTSCRGW